MVCARADVIRAEMASRHHTEAALADLLGVAGLEVVKRPRFRPPIHPTQESNMERHQRNAASRVGLGTLIVGMVLSLMAFGVAPAAAAAASQVNLASAPPGPASSGSMDPLVIAALERIEAGTWTQADLDLIRQYPDIAAQVPDPSQPPEVLSIASFGGNPPRVQRRPRRRP